MSYIQAAFNGQKASISGEKELVNTENGAPQASWRISNMFDVPLSIRIAHNANLVTICSFPQFENL
ncbi:MAG: hypothetical protein OEV28_01290 [Nitrospirota bacterium]|nr:hypothetical protein [Nitrospirota bacterium]